MQQQTHEHREKHHKCAHVQAARQRTLHREWENGGKTLSFSLLYPCFMIRHRRQRAADENAGENRRGGMNEIQRRACTGGRKNTRAAHAEQKARPCVVAEGEQPLAFLLRQRAVFHKRGGSARTDGIAAAKPQRKR